MLLKDFVELPIYDRDKIYFILLELKISSHNHFSDYWESVQTDCLLNHAIELIKGYESHKLELDGLSFWYLNKILSHSSLNSDAIHKVLDTTSLIKAIIKTGLENKVYCHCYSILQTLINSNESIFRTICIAGLEYTTDSLNQAVYKSENYISLIFLLCRHLKVRWSESKVQIALEFLSSAGWHCVPDNAHNYFFASINEITEKCFVVSTTTTLPNTSLMTSAVIFLRVLVILQNSHANQLLGSGTLNRVFDLVLTQSLLPMSCRAHFLSFLSELHKHGDKAVQTEIKTRVSLRVLLEDIGFSDPLLLESSVDFFLAIYVPPRTDASALTQAYVKAALTQAVEYIRSRDADALFSGCRTIRRFSRAIDILQPDLSEVCSYGRQLLLNKVDEMENLDLKEVIVADGLSALCGWRRIYWRSTKSRDLRDITSCLEDIRGTTAAIRDDFFEDTDTAVDVANMSRNYSDATAEDRISGDSLEYTSKRLLGSAAFVDGFIGKWRDLSYLETVRHVSYFSAVSHAIGMEALETLVSLQDLYGILVELFLCDRTGAEDPSVLQEKALLLISDIALWKPHLMQARLLVCERVLEMIRQYRNMVNRALMLVCLSNLVVSTSTEQGKGGVSSLLLSRFSDLHVLVKKLGDSYVLGPILFLCRELVPSLVDLEMAGLSILIGWLVRGLSCEIARTRTRACQIIFALGMSHRSFFHDTASRREVEEGVMFAMASAVEAADIIEATKAASICVFNFNKRPVWAKEPWSYDWRVTRRLIEEVELGDIVANVLARSNRFCKADRVLVLAFSLELAAYVFASGRINNRHPLSKRLLSTLLDGIPTNITLAVTDSANRAIGNESCPAVSSLSKTELGVVPFELLAFHSLQMLQACLCHDLEACLQRPALQSEPPLSASIPSVMQTFPRNLGIQRFGVDVLKTLTVRRIDLSGLGRHAPPALVTAISACPDDLDLLRSFCCVLQVLGSTSSEDLKTVIFTSGAHRPLVTTLRVCSVELTGVILATLRQLAAGSSDRVGELNRCGVSAAVLKSLDRFSNTVQVQIEGLRLLMALRKYEDVEKMSNVSHQDRILKRVRSTLNHCVQEGHLGAEWDAEEINRLLLESAPPAEVVPAGSCGCSIG